MSCGAIARRGRFGIDWASAASRRRSHVKRPPLAGIWVRGSCVMRIISSAVRCNIGLTDCKGNVGVLLTTRDQPSAQQKLDQSNTRPFKVPTATTHAKRAVGDRLKATSKGTPFMHRYKGSSRSGCRLSFPRGPDPRRYPLRQTRQPLWRRRCRDAAPSPLPPACCRGTDTARRLSR